LQLRQGVFRRLKIVSNRSIDPLDPERDVTNVIPLKPNGEGLNPTQVIDRLHALCEKLQQVKSEALLLEHLLHRGPQATKQALARSATSETIVLLSTALDAVVEALAELIVETTAELIVPHSPAKT
jgi:hypothetical protein